MMRVNKTLLGLSFFIFFLIGAERAALACSCMPPGPPKEEMERARAVFAGEVIEITKTPSETAAGCQQKSGSPSAGDGLSSVRVKFKVSRSWKLVAGEEVVVTTPQSSAACGYSFRKGVSYIVYAYGGEEGRELSTGICSRTKRLADAAEDLRELGEGQAVSSAISAAPVAVAAKPVPRPKPRRRTRRTVRRRS